ncbi:MAG: Wzz/FepE/Etk N-terminal domain-containing protein [Gemmatimonadales bacterium]
MPSPDISGQHRMSGTSLAPPGRSEEVSLVGLVNVLLRHRALVAGVALFSCLGAILYALAQPRSYTATSSFMPQAPRAQGNLSGIAAQLGLALPTAGGAQSPAFYADLLHSRELLGDAVDSRYEFQTDTAAVSGNLLEIQPQPGRAETRRERSVRALKRMIRPGVAQQTGVVTLGVTANHPALAQQINQRLLDLVNRFNMVSRQSQAGAERKFIEQRLAEVKADLRSAENRQQTFLQRNRDFQNSPELTFEQDRLEREVTRQQQVYTALSQSYEQAKIEEVRDTPVITIVEQPEVPALPDSRGLLMQAVLGLLLGTLLGGILAFGKEFLTKSRQEDPEDFEEFTTLRQEAWDDLLHPWRPLRRLARRGRASS